jgi:CRP-like cAMP-binding protein
MADQNTVLFCLPAELLLGEGLPEGTIRETCLRSLLNLVAQENMKKEYRLAILAQNGLRDRIRTYLTMQARKRGQSTFEIPFSREELASFLCVNRSALSHELSKMQAEGLIQFRKNRFTLNIGDPD